MSNNKHYVGLSASDIEKGQEFLPFSKVCVIVGEDENGAQLCYFARLVNGVATACTATEYDAASGRPLETNIETFYVPQGQTATQAGQALAVSMLNQIKGYVYKPYSARGAFLDDDAELGDGVTLGGIYSVIAAQDITFDSLMTSEIEASGADETDNEFGDYTPKSDREVKRLLNQTITRFNVKTGQIEAEVSGIYAPEFVSGTTYYKGDVVKVTSGNTVTYYEYTNATASTTAPPNSNYWSVVSAPSVESILNIGLKGITLSYNSGVSVGNNSAYVTLNQHGVAIGGGVVKLTGNVVADSLTVQAVNAISIKASQIDVSQGKITANQLDVNNITVAGAVSAASATIAGSLTAQGMSAITIDASQITTGTLTAGALSAGSVALGNGGTMTLTSATSGSYAVDILSNAALRLSADDGAVYLKSRFGVYDPYAGKIWYNAAFQLHNALLGDGNPFASVLGSLVGNSNGVYNLGYLGNAWRQLYQTESSINTSDRKKKKDIVYGLEKYDSLFDSLKPCHFKFRGKEHDRVHLGMIAQDVEDELGVCEIDTEDFGAFVKGWNESEQDYDYALRYTEFIPLLIWEVQQLKARVKELEA